MPYTAQRTQHEPATWSLKEWNAALFRHFFRVIDGDSTPVSRLVVTGGELRVVARAEAATPLQVHEWFRSAMRQRLAASGLSLCTDAMNLEWGTGRDKLQQVPPYFAHLVVTCVAAAGTSSAKRPQGEFRQRLNEFLGRGEGNSSYNLGGLPELWEMLRTWLEKATSRGEPYRRIVLPHPGNFCIIGYSLKLAFPTSKDQAKLIDLFDPCGYPADPPVVPLLKRIESVITKFSPRFRAACADFRSAYFDGEQDLYTRPFWSSVRDAVRAARDKRAHAKGHDRVAAVLRLDDDSIDQGDVRKFILSLLVSSTVECPQELHSIEVPGCDAGGCEHLVVASNSDDGLSVGNLVLSGRLASKLPVVDVPDLMRAVAQGLLLFSQNEDGTWLANVSRPGPGPIRALLRGELADLFVAAIRKSGANVRKSVSLYNGWHEAEGFDGEHLATAQFDQSRLKDITCLMDTIRPPRITFVGGVRVDGGFLGRRSALPRVVAESKSVALRIRSTAPNDGNNQGMALIADLSSTSNFHLPGPPLLPHDLDGEFIIESLREDTLVAARRFEARSNILAFDYLPPSSPSTWFTEGGLRPNYDLSDNSQPFLGVAADIVDGDGLVTVSVTPGVPASNLTTDDVASELSEVLAAVSLRKRGIPEGELLGWFRAVLSLDGPEMFDAARAWAEAGLLNVCSFRRWRMRAYFAVCPRLVCFKDQHGGVRAVLSGLVPSGLLRQLHDVAPVHKVTVFVPLQPSRILPRITHLEAGSLNDLVGLSERLSLVPPARLLPLRSVVSAIEEIMGFPEPLIRNHRIEGYWNNESARFERNQSAAPFLKWFRRDDAPDGYAVCVDENHIFETRSKTWGRLVTAHINGDCLFRPGAAATVVRSKDDGSYLPMPFARWASLTSGISSGPQSFDGNSTGYTYVFSSHNERDAALNLLWPRAIPEALVHQAQWLVRVASASPLRRDAPFVIVPPAIRAAFAPLQNLPGCGSLTTLARVPRHLFSRLLALSARCQHLGLSSGGGR